MPVWAEMTAQGLMLSAVRNKMSIVIEKLSVADLKTLIENHRNKGATDKPLYKDALRELEKRTGKGLDFDKSFAIIKRAAKQRRFVSYKELADASGADWAQVHYAIGGHLWRLVEYAYRRGWPMLSAIVVNKANLAIGTMDPETLRGFISAARELGRNVGSDEKRFLKDEQAQVFEWAQTQHDE